jgi:hypothetical protein
VSEALAPRVLIVRRPTELELLIEEHGTREQAKFSLRNQAQVLGEIEERDVRVHGALDLVMRAIPRSWRSVTLLRSDLDRFVFEPKDIVVVVGQDGLVANAAKYLDGQYVVGVNPDRSAYEGVLVPHSPEAATDLLADVAAGRAIAQARTMVEVKLDDGQQLLALNEIFLGHQSHQSARYRFAWDKAQERQSSSGIIVATGTGSTGWARSINQERNGILSLPAPEERKLAYFVREAFPGSGFETATTCGYVTDSTSLQIVSEMNAGGVIFGDGIEDDHISFAWGMQAEVRPARQRLNLVP